MAIDAALREPLLGARSPPPPPPPGPPRRGALSTLTFSWIAPVLAAAAARDRLEQADLPPLAPAAEPAACGAALGAAWAHERAAAFAAPRRPSLLRALAAAFGHEWAALGALKLAGDALGFLPVWALSQLLHALAAPPPGGAGPASAAAARARAARAAALLAAALAARAALGVQYSFRAGVLGARVRAGLQALCLRQTLSLPSAAARGAAAGSGRLQALAAVDAERVSSLGGGLHEAAALPLQIAAALALLYSQVRDVFLAALAVCLLLVPANRALAVRIAAASARGAAARDARLRALSEALRSARALKAAQWEAAAAARAGAARAEELAALAVKKRLDALCVFAWAATSLACSVATFGAAALVGAPLTAAVVFTSLALFGTLLQPLNALPWVINGLAEAGVSASRLRDFLELEAPDWSCQAPPPGLALAADAPAARLRNATFTWGPAAEGASPALADVSLDIPVGALVAVTGPVGSGKSALLLALLGELRLARGEAALPGTAGGKVAYVAQDPFIAAGSFLDNLRLGAPAAAGGAGRAAAALRAAALGAEAARRAAGAASAAGARGVALSGGQRARLALARALYHAADCELILLDDVLAAVDAKTAAFLLKCALLGALRERTVVAATHAPALLAAADVVVRLEGGRVVEVTRRAGAADGAPDESRSDEASSEEEEAGGKCAVEGGGAEADDEEDAEREGRAEGRVRWAVYAAYARAQGGWAPAALGTLALMQATRSGADVWLARWTSRAGAGGGALAAPLAGFGGLHSVGFGGHHGHHHHHAPPGGMDPDVRRFMQVFLSLAAANAACTLARAFSFAEGGLVAARRLHARLLAAVLAAPPAYLDAQPAGRLLNRFAGDTAAADDALPFITNIFLANAAGLAGVAAILALAAPAPAAAAAVLLTPGYFALQRYYRRVPRELRRLDAVARSPVLGAFAAAAEGGPTLRGLRACTAFERAGVAALARQQRAGLAALAAVQWLSLRLQLVAAALAGAVAAGAAARGPGAGAAGLAGLALAYCLPVTGLLGGLLATSAETEAEMVAVERVLELAALLAQAETLPPAPAAPPGGGAPADAAAPPPTRALAAPGAPPPGWPAAGRVEFRGVWLRYASAGAAPVPWALRGLSLAAGAGARAGLVGRTGAGKSSALAALLRLAEISAGAVEVDGVDVRRVPLARLRRAVALVPQAPAVFSASVRENLDPYARASDAAVVRALRGARLWEALAAGVAAGEGGGGGTAAEKEAAVLRAPLGEGGLGLSHGQAQLLAAARALLARARVVALDEPAAAADPATAAALRAALAEGLAGATVLTVAHRLAEVRGCDAVVVVEAGRAAEAGAPAELARRPGSRFAAMLAAQGETFC
jgi:ATP-binding cassette subfamily C (CFTR/MRP) protein 10